MTDASDRTLNWSYDGIYRLTNETITSDPSHNNGSVGYGLDPVGNRLSESSTISGVGSGSFSYNLDDELSAENYDANGNVLSSGVKTFAYDSQNELVSMNGGAFSACIMAGNPRYWKFRIQGRISSAQSDSAFSFLLSERTI
jgi:hypothetical protein